MTHTEITVDDFIQWVNKFNAETVDHILKRSVIVDGKVYSLNTQETELMNESSKTKELTKEEFEELLYMKDEPDIVIRTGGQTRLSNFLPWQSAYSEWFFTNTYWPAFSREELLKIVEEFGERKRNFGK